MSGVQVRKSEQISFDLSFLIDYDQPVTDDVLKILTSFLCSSCELYRYKPRKLFYKYEYDGLMILFLLESG